LPGAPSRKADQGGFVAANGQVEQVGVEAGDQRAGAAGTVGRNWSLGEDQCVVVDMRWLEDREDRTLSSASPRPASQQARPCSRRSSHSKAKTRLGRIDTFGQWAGFADDQFGQVFFAADARPPGRAARYAGSGWRVARLRPASGRLRQPRQRNSKLPTRIGWRTNQSLRRPAGVEQVVERGVAVMGNPAGVSAISMPAAASSGAGSRPDERGRPACR
jgi:hypothetical protein